MGLVKDLRFWSIVLAAAWFLVGLGVGVAVSERSDTRSPLEDYADTLSARFDLAPNRRRVLLQLLDQYETEREEIRHRHLARTRDAMEPDLRALDARFESTIRNTILPPEQRERYDAFARPLAQVSS
ncbi:MAG: hypothetical protein AAF726_02360 [Planctomycetota bacterium]